MSDGIPEYYLGGTPAPNAGLSPLQLALIEKIRSGSENPLFINSGFAREIWRYANSKPLTPINIDETSGYSAVWDWWNGRDEILYAGAAKVINQVATGITGRSYIIIGEEIYVERVAQDCGPDEEERFELVQVGKRAEIAEGTYAVYGKIIYSGTVAQAGGEYVGSTV